VAVSVLPAWSSSDDLNLLVDSTASTIGFGALADGFNGGSLHTKVLIHNTFGYNGGFRLAD
jgi:hypothetical protein